MTLVEQLALGVAGSLFGALLGGALSWGRAMHERRLSLTLALYSEFHAPAFNHIRILAHRALESAPDMPAAYARSLGEEKDAVSSLVHFWEKVAVLKQSGALERRLLARLFGQYARWWRELLCRGAGAQDDEWGQTLKDIDRALAQIIRQDTRKGARK